MYAIHRIFPPNVLTKRQTDSDNLPRLGFFRPASFNRLKRAFFLFYSRQAKAMNNGYTNPNQFTFFDIDTDLS
jgi:hypothetical protein